jgi:AraC-like DNA-binding protein
LLTEHADENPALLSYLQQRGFEAAELPIDNHPTWVSDVMIDPPGAFVIGSQLAEEGGWDLIKQLKNNPETRNIPVIFYALSMDKETGATLEFDYLTKPVGSGDLIQALERQGVASEDDRKSKTILVVDDDIHILNLHTRIVHSHLAGCRVLQAHNGLEALSIMENELPDLVLLDLMMPEMDGFAVLEVMQAKEQLRRIPVVVLTAQVLTALDMTRLQRGVAAVLSKGMFSADEVQMQVESALGRRKHLGTEAQRVTRQAMAYIHEHYAEPITRHQLSQHVGLSERHLNRCFHEETGMPVMNYLNRYRIRQAKTLLEKGEQNVTEVGLAVGFSGSSHFVRAFRQDVGVTPGAYQRGERCLK